MAAYRPILVIPTYNTGILLAETIRIALTTTLPVLVVIDGSTDSSDKIFASPEFAENPLLTIIRFPRNRGKGSAILAAARQSLHLGYTHVLCMDADGQHPISHVPAFLQISQTYPQAAVFGRPQFDESAPCIRVQGRKISNFFANLESLGWGIDDSLFGMRLYPISSLLAAFKDTRFARRFDFEPEIAVRLAWLRTPLINLPTPVRYIPKEEGGVSQFKYFRDNALLTFMHARLLAGFFLRLPILLFRSRNPLDHLSPP